MQIFDFRMMNFLKFSCLFYSFFDHFFEHRNLFFEFESLIFHFFLKIRLFLGYFCNRKILREIFRWNFKPINKNKLFVFLENRKIEVPVWLFKDIEPFLCRNSPTFDQKLLFETRNYNFKLGKKVDFRYKFHFWPKMTNFTW